MSKKPNSPEDISAAIRKSPKYKVIAPDAIDRIVREEFAKTGADCEKRARNRLHQIADAFINQTEQGKLWALLESGDMDKALLMHASTRERIADKAEFAALIAKYCAPGGKICDAACGLNPLMLGQLGYNVLGLDIQCTCVSVINAWARSGEWNVSARAADLIGMTELPECELTLLMKLLPVLDAQRPGEGMRLLKATRSPKVLVSFPTRSLGGRQVGMEKNYGEKFEMDLPAEFEILERAVIGTELFYALNRRGTNA